MLTVRRGYLHDVNQVLDLWEVAAGPTRTRPTEAAVMTLLEADPEALVVAEEDGAIVGTLIVGWDGWRCHLYRLAVDPAHRRHGVATRLVEAAVARADSCGASRVDAMVDAGNELGTAFWRAFAFNLDEVEQRWSLVVRP